MHVGEALGQRLLSAGLIVTVEVPSCAQAHQEAEDNSVQSAQELASRQGDAAKGPGLLTVARRRVTHPHFRVWHPPRLSSMLSAQRLRSAGAEEPALLMFTRHSCRPAVGVVNAWLAMTFFTGGTESHALLSRSSGSSGAADSLKRPRRRPASGSGTRAARRTGRGTAASRRAARCCPPPPAPGMAQRQTTGKRLLRVTRAR